MQAARSNIAHLTMRFPPLSYTIRRRAYLEKEFCPFVFKLIPGVWVVFKSSWEAIEEFLIKSSTDNCMSPQFYRAINVFYALIN